MIELTDKQIEESEHMAEQMRTPQEPHLIDRESMEMLSEKIGAAQAIITALKITIIALTFSLLLCVAWRWLI